MQALIDLAREDEEIRRIATRAMESPGVQGVTLHIDDLWLWEWNGRELFGDREFYSFERFRFDESIWRYGIRSAYFADSPINDIPVRPPTVNDLIERMRFWDQRRDYLHLRVTLPVILTICLRPEPKEIPRFFSERFQIAYEVRPLAQLSSNPKRLRRPLQGGLSTGVGTASYGTMGGVVRDLGRNGRMFGVTCAHVMTSGTVDQPARVDWKSPAPIGSVHLHTPLQQSSGLCTPDSTSGLNTVDVALIEIDHSIPANLGILDIGPLTGITPIAKIGQGQVVEFTGRSSGNRTLKVGRLGLIYEHQHNGQTYCFQNVIQLNWPRFYKLVRRPVTSGDSGSWICAANAKGISWCGMIIGDDRLHGYAVYAAIIEKWWNQQGMSLSVL